MVNSGMLLVAGTAVAATVGSGGAAFVLSGGTTSASVLDGGNEFARLDLLTVWITERHHHPGTRGRNGREASFLKDSSTWHIPSIWENQYAATAMKSAKVFCLLNLRSQSEYSQMP